MNKIKYFIILTILLVLSFVVELIPAQDICYVNFDVNGDGIGWTIADLIHLEGMLNGDSTYTEFVYLADVNFDCTIDDGDIDIFYCIMVNGSNGFMMCMGERYWSCCDPLLTVGACCLSEDSCTIRSEENCAAIGGDYLGDGTSCLPENPCTCCQGIRGNADCDPNDDINVADIVFMVRRLFIADFPCCALEENVDGIINGNIEFDVADVVYLVNYIFRGGPAPVACYPE